MRRPQEESRDPLQHPRGNGTTNNDDAHQARLGLGRFIGAILVTAAILITLVASFLTAILGTRLRLGSDGQLLLRDGSPVTPDAFWPFLEAAATVLDESIPWIAPGVATLLVAILVWLAIPARRAEVIAWETQTSEPLLSGGAETIELEHTRSVVALLAIFLAAAYLALWGGMCVTPLFTPLPWGKNIIGFTLFLPAVLVFGATIARHGQGSLASRFVIAENDLRAATDAKSRVLRHTPRTGMRRFYISLAIAGAVAIAAPTLAVVNLSNSSGDVVPIWVTLTGVAIAATLALLGASGVGLFFTPDKAFRWVFGPILWVSWLVLTTSVVVIIIRAFWNFPGAAALAIVGFTVPGLIWLLPWPGHTFAIAALSRAPAARNVRTAKNSYEKLRQELWNTFEETRATETGQDLTSRRCWFSRVQVKRARS